MNDHRRKIDMLIRACTAASLTILLTLFIAARATLGADMIGTFLVATRDMPDAMFQRTVILMIPSTQETLLAGVIINQPTQVPLAKLFKNVVPRPSETAFFGGPVETETASLLFRAASPPEKSSSVVDDIYVSTDLDAIARLVKNPGIGEMRLILGRAQWLKEQLHAEIVAGAWYVMPARSELVLSNPKSLWTTLVARGELMEAGRIEPAPHYSAELINDSSLEVSPRVEAVSPARSYTTWPWLSRIAIVGM